MRRPTALLGLVFSLIPAVASATPPAPSAPPPHVSAAPHPSAPHVAPSAPAPSATLHVAPPTAPPATIHVTPAVVAESKPVVIPAYKPPPAGADMATLIATSKALLARQAARTASMLPTSGFTSLEEVAQKTAAMGPTRAAAVELLKSEDKLEFTMRAESANRDSIMSRGFLNQHDVGRSRGMLNPQFRATVEASFLGVSKEEYAQLPNSIRPKYGYLRPAKETGVTIPGYDGAFHYGEDIFVFKHDAVRDHLTVYPTDSLSQSAGSAEPSQWYHAMLPWADRMLLAPQMELRSDVHQLQIAGSPAPPGFQARPGASHASYLEIQIWRPIGLSEVERFEFQSVPPSGEFLKALRSNGVKIFQIGQPAEWHGDVPTTTAPTSFVFFHSQSKAA